MAVEKVIEANIVEAGYHKGFFIRNISFELSKGEILVITGRSGSGKTTLLKTLLNILHLSNGYIKGVVLIKNKPITQYSSEELYNLISYIPQDPWYAVIGHVVYVEYCHALSVANIKCDPKKLKIYGLDKLENHITYGLSAGEYQRLLWASSIDKGSEILFLDEPLIYIDSTSRSRFIGFVKKFIETGGTAIIVDHMPDNWVGFDPKILVLDKGVQKYLGPYREDLLPKPIIKIKKQTNQYKGRKPLLVSKNIWFKYPGENYVLRNISFEAYSGEITGISGKNGAGKTTLLKILAGILKPNKGNIVRYGRIIYLPENPLLYYSYPTPREELFASARDPREFERITKRFSLEELLDRPLSMLSSGERRRIALASAFLAGYDIYLLDEPSGGLDNYSLKELLDEIMFLSKNNKAVIIASHDERLYPYFDKTCILREGVLICE